MKLTNSFIFDNFLFYYDRIFRFSFGYFVQHGIWLYMRANPGARGTWPELTVPVPTAEKTPTVKGAIGRAENKTKNAFQIILVKQFSERRESV